MIKLTDTAGKVSTMDYDEDGNVTAIYSADGSASRYSYNSNNLQTSVTDFNGQKTSYTYDSNGLLTEMKGGSKAAGKFLKYLNEKIVKSMILYEAI